jgi:hypothetical protein
MKNKLPIAFISFLITFLLLGIIRFITFAEEKHTHYHANFALFINGTKVNFSDNKYMEEVSACYSEGDIQPRQRVHLHEKNGDLIHVHHDGVTWGHLLTNLEFALSDDYLIDDKGIVYKQDDTNSLSFILNGKAIDNPYNTLMKSEDRLLINYGPEKESDLITNRFNEVKNNAGEYNHKQDPSTCSGQQHSSLKDRLVKSFLF